MENTTQNKTQIYNLVILDKSGSMSSIANAAISGFNETIGGIRSAQKQFADTQEHFVSLMVFCNCDKSFIYDNVPVAEVKELTSRDYRPCCCTPLYDAMGISLNKLLNDIKDNPDATAVVTIITDGLENSSTEYRLADIKALVERLKKEEGWNFSYIGTNQDVEKSSRDLSIDNHMAFADDPDGMEEAWRKERNARSRMYHAYQMESIPQGMSKKEFFCRHNHRSEKYVSLMVPDHRITPEFITDLKADEVFVFGSNTAGAHHGGAARLAERQFGAIMGQGEGLQGQSYAIPTIGLRMGEIEAAVLRFIDFAQLNPDKKFFVTRIGCGIAGFTPKEMAPFFASAYGVENITLPRDFWKFAL